MSAAKSEPSACRQVFSGSIGKVKTLKSSDNDALDELRAIHHACATRNKRALYAAFAREHKRLRPNEPIDIERVRICASFYAGEIFGWELRP